MATPFATTSWSLVANTREPGEAATAATAALCRQYWQPLYVYARRAGRTEHEAEDTVQEFLVHVVEHQVFAQADRARGRFRTFLLSALQQFMSRQHRDQNRQKRAPQEGVQSLDFRSAELGIQSADTGLSPAQAFERAWALSQLETSWQRVAAEFAEAGKSTLYERLRPAIGGAGGSSVREIAVALGMTEGAVNVAAHRLRRRFGEVLREVVAGTLASPDNVDDEISHLRAVLSGTLK